MEKSQILDQNDGLTPLQKCQFFDFLNFLFLLPRKAFLRSRIEKNTFLWPILPKKSWKNGHFLTKTISQQLCKNVYFSTFWTSCFYYLERRFFVQEYSNTHFPGLYCLKKKDGKMANFWPKPWFSPFGKMSIFRHFELLFFIA